MWVLLGAVMATHILQGPKFHGKERPVLNTHPSGLVNKIPLYGAQEKPVPGGLMGSLES